MFRAGTARDWAIIGLCYALLLAPVIGTAYVYDSPIRAATQGKVVYSILYVPKAAIQEDQIKPLKDYCLVNKIRVVIGRDSVAFEGPSEKLKAIADFIFGRSIKL